MADSLLVVRRFVRRMLFQTVHDVSPMLDRELAGREASPTGGVVDSRTVKAPAGTTRGYDAAKKTVGRKRHIAVDTDGRLLTNLTAADVSDSAGAHMILDGVRKRWPWPKHLFADGAYDRTRLLDKAAYLDFVLAIVRRDEEQAGFHVIRRRWVVERTFGWMSRWRRLALISVSMSRARADRRADMVGGLLPSTVLVTSQTLEA